ncbi:MAG: hypothetical protein EOO62_15430 [Hymenobacter sp.]|nr:MAG: hypothetical protein EOO62_15430 [Hymenobacter sp.]
MGAAPTYRRAIGSTLDPDPDVRAFVLAAGLTQAAHQRALLHLVRGLKAQGLWSLLLAIYPFVGGHEAAHRWNLRNPAQFQLNFVTGQAQSHNALGVSPMGNTLAATGIIPSQHLRVDSTTLSYWCGTDEDDLSSKFPAMLGAAAADYSKGLYMLANCTPQGQYFGRVHSESDLAHRGGPSAVGHHLLTRTDATTMQRYQNTTLLASSAIPASALTDSQLALFAILRTGDTTLNYETKRCQFAAIGAGFTPAQANAYHALVQQFQTDLGR